jgi:hypothetical protein
MNGRSCVVVLIGSGTANRKWINHEIIKGWDAGKGVLGVHVHNLKNSAGSTCAKGANPFDHITHGPTGKRLSAIAKAYDPLGTSSTDVYNRIKNNLETWIETAIDIRGKN